MDLGVSGCYLSAVSEEILSRPKRMVSIDAYRGLVMLLMMAEVLHLRKVAAAFPESSFWELLAYHQSHVPWVGCSLHDLIQPSFSFLVGVALPFSIASRVSKGQSTGFMISHAVWRAIVLVLLGVFLRSLNTSQTNWTFEDTLSQIGLGYPVLFLLGFRSFRAQLIALAAILISYWGAWALYPLPGEGFDYAAIGASADWPHHAQGFAAHWNKHLNLGAAFDRWFLNLFPRPDTYVVNSGGYMTLSFIPTLGTMVMGLIAGQWIKQDLEPTDRIKRFALAGVLGLVLGTLMHVLGLCPIVKRIWTPSWTLFSGGWCFLILAAFYIIVDWKSYKRWAFPLVVVGMNSITAYCIAHLFHGFIAKNFTTHFGQDIFQIAGRSFAPLIEGIVVLAIFWLILYWMYRRRLFLRI